MRHFKVTYKAFTDWEMEYIITETMIVSSYFECLVRDELAKIIGDRLLCVTYIKEII